MKKVKSLLRLAIITAVIMIAAAIPAFADEVNESVKDARNGVMQVRLVHVDKDGNESVVGGGTGFLINSDTMVTCSHVINVTQNSENYEWAQANVPNFDVKNIKIRVIVRNDVTLEATIVKQSEKSDFAILELEQSVNNRNVLKLNSNATSETQQVFALGFPDNVAVFQNENAYTSDDVTISDGRVTKTNESDGVKYVQHSATLSSGYSGGPLVNYDGEVIAINRGTVDENNYSVAISELTSVLDDLGVEYTSASGSIQSSSDDEENTETIDDSEDETVTEEPETETEAEKPTVPETKKSEDNGEIIKGISNTVLIAIIAVVVVVIIVIIIIIVAMGGKKKSAPQAGPQPGPYPGPQPRPQAGPQPGSFPGPGPIGGQGPSFDGEEGTTVLNEGSADTTVLGMGAGGRTIIRVKTGERININKPEFIIGKERRRVDYCVSDNSSVSRTHVKLISRAGELHIMDMNATNGTFVNGTRISGGQEARISSGDKFKLADEEFQVL